MTVLGRQEGHGKGGQGAQHLDGALNGKGKESCTMEKGGVSGREATVMTEHGPREEGLALGTRPCGRPRSPHPGHRDQDRTPTFPLGVYNVNVRVLGTVEPPQFWCCLLKSDNHGDFPLRMKTRSTRSLRALCPEVV